jgi:glycosyltransferase involved in cell wall biosynthesis
MNIKYKITVFTATYNREHTLDRLYDSLLKQTNKKFEWLIVDDGSTDASEELIQGFIAENKLNIKYYKQENSGKHRAINKGVKLAKGELFFIVDSDDYIVNDALRVIYNEYKNISEDNSFAGLSGLKVYPNMVPTGGKVQYDKIDTSALDIRMKHKVKGDLTEVYKTDILKQYPFPNFAGERFCAESLVWNRIAQKYKLRYTNHKLYICEYLEDGLSNASVKNRIMSPGYASINYRELYSYNIPLKFKIKAGINYWRFAFYKKDNFFTLLKDIGYSSIVTLPFGVLLKLRDIIYYKVNIL